MTNNQIKNALMKAGIDISSGVKIESREVEVCVDYRVNNSTGRSYGECNERKTKILANKIMKSLNFGGFRTGYGAWVLRENYVPMGDWNDKSSACHY